MTRFEKILLGTIGFLGLTLASSAGALTCTNVFPTALNGYSSSSCVASSWANALEAKIGINGSSATSSLDYQINSLFTSYGSQLVKATSTTGLLRVLNNLSDLASATLARANLGLGDSATLSSSTFAQISKNLSDVASATIARQNLGLGSIAIFNSTDYLSSSTSYQVPVSAGSNIVLNGASIAVTSTPSFTSVKIGNASSSLIGVDSSGLIVATTSAISVNQAANYSWSGTNSWSATSTFNGPLILNGYTISSSTSFSKFGGNGSDGALSLSSGSTTIALGGASVFVKNYSSLSITGTSSLTFSGASQAGTIVIFKVSGNAVITSTTSTVISLVGLGAQGAAGVSSGAGATGQSATMWFASQETGGGGGGGASGGQAGGGGGGGASAYASGAVGATGGTGGTAGAASVSPFFATSSVKYYKVYVRPGSGGGSGGSGNNNGNASLAAGNGGGAFYMEVGGSLTFTGSTIDVSGTVGGTGSGGSGNSGGSGGGGGGSVVILANSIISNTGTTTFAGGNGGGGTANGGAGATGFGFVGLNTEF